MNNILSPKEIEYEEIQTEHGIFTSNIHLGLTAQEVYEQWLVDKDKPTESIEDKKIDIEESLKAVLAGDYQTLAYILYPEDFE